MGATGGWMGSTSALYGGFTWQSAAYCLWESAVAIALDIGLIVVFREKLNRQSKFIKTLSDNSFAVYVFHTPIIIGAALLLRPLALPPAAKFAVMVIVCLPLVFLAAHFIVRRIPLLKKIM
jgi:surface polysaccharide O-acyltransferase-like enzyme